MGPEFGLYLTGSLPQPSVTTHLAQAARRSLHHSKLLSAVGARSNGRMIHRGARLAGTADGGDRDRPTALCFRCAIVHADKTSHTFSLTVETVSIVGDRVPPWM